MIKSLKAFLLAPLLVVLLASCGYDGHYRYPCQDPANWKTQECQPPICTTNGACPIDLVGEAVFNGEQPVVESDETIDE